ncbi:MAG: helix-turn-helix domain-containing protein [Candidatus Actinomarinaceae bacterium]
MIKKWKLLKRVNSTKQLNDASRRVMFFLLDRENNKTGKLFPSHARIADDSGLSLRSVSRGINDLIKNNFLIKLKKGYTGKATEYKINYDLAHATFDQSTRHNCPKYTPQLAVQLTNELTNELTNKEHTPNMSTNKEEEKKKVHNILKSITKQFNPNYRAVADGNKRKYLDPESIRQRYVKKTGNYDESFKWKELYLNPKTSKEAWEYAVYLGIVKEFKKNGR